MCPYSCPHHAPNMCAKEGRDVENKAVMLVYNNEKESANQMSRPVTVEEL